MRLRSVPLPLMALTTSPFAASLATDLALRQGRLQHAGRRQGRRGESSPLPPPAPAAFSLDPSRQACQALVKMCLYVLVLMLLGAPELNLLPSQARAASAVPACFLFFAFVLSCLVTCPLSFVLLFLACSPASARSCSLASPSFFCCTSYLLSLVAVSNWVQLSRLPADAPENAREDLARPTHHTRKAIHAAPPPTPPSPSPSRSPSSSSSSPPCSCARHAGPDQGPPPRCARRGGSPSRA